MLFLTLGPHLYYADPYTGTLKGEIRWTPELKLEPRTFKNFYLHCQDTRVSQSSGFKCIWGHNFGWENLSKATFTLKGLLETYFMSLADKNCFLKGDLCVFKLINWWA